MEHSNKHIFAIFCPTLSSLIKKGQENQALHIQDPQLALRLNTVLRLKQGEECILFDHAINSLCFLQEVSKKGVQVIIKNSQQNTVLKPHITFILPLLKKDDFETALYSLVELGASSIQLITTQKTQRAWGGEKELDRAQRVMIAAAEQSKNYAMPELKSPVALPVILDSISESAVPKIYFDPEGQSALQVINEMDNQVQEFTLMVGPEGDLTAEEKKLLIQAGFTFCSLTPTVLRSVQAIVIGLGIFRSFLR